MTEPLPKNLQIRLAVLYKKYEHNEFSFNEALDSLEIDKTYLGKILSQLVSSGWISKSRDDKDNRIKYYKLNQFDAPFENLNMISRKRTDR